MANCGHKRKPRKDVRLLAVGLLGLVACAWISSCGGSSEREAATLSKAELIEQIQTATPNPVTPEQVAEAFALGSDSTDLQRQLIEKDLVGSVVEWDFLVYDVDYKDGVYEVTSQPIPITSTDAVQLIRIIAKVEAQGEVDEELLRKIKTNEVLRIRGVVQDIFLRTVVTIEPAVVVVGGAAESVEM